MQVQGLLGADGHAHQDAQELELEHVLIQARRRVQEEPGKTKDGDIFFNILFWKDDFKRTLLESDSAGDGAGRRHEKNLRKL